MAIVNAIGTVIMAIVNGIVALFDIIIGCKSHVPTYHPNLAGASFLEHAC
jgi:hypothetical protein